MDIADIVDSFENKRYSQLVPPMLYILPAFRGSTSENTTMAMRGI